MGLWKRGQQYWIDVVVNGQRYRESLGVADATRGPSTRKGPYRRVVASAEPIPPSVGDIWGC